MKRFLEEPHALEALLAPHNDLEKHLIDLPEFRFGLLWGEPRYGHPEGKVALHVREVMDNIHKLPDVSASDRLRLRLIALAHDTFKYREDRGRPRDWSRHHGRLARDFMQQFTSDELLLDILETHDDAYYAWLSSRSEQFRLENDSKTLEVLTDRFKSDLQMYYLFFKCDTQTGDKNQAPLRWFEQSAPGIRIV